MVDGVRRVLINVEDWKPSDDCFSSLLSAIPVCEHQAITKFVKLDDRKRAIVSRFLQYSLIHQLMRIPFDEIIIHRTLEGKPYLRNAQSSSFPNFNFSVSHDGRYVGIASEPLCLVGLDIVSIPIRPQDRSLEFVENFSSHFTTFEWRSIVTAGTEDNILAEFFRYWSLKEAYVKAIGVGVGYGLHRLEFHHANWTNISLLIEGIKLRNWKFKISKLDERHWISIARGLPTRVVEHNENIQRSIETKDEEYLDSLLLPDPDFSLFTVEELIASVFAKKHSRLAFFNKKIDEVSSGL